MRERERIGKQFPVSPCAGLGDEWGLVCATSARRVLKDMFSRIIATHVYLKRTEAVYIAYISKNGRENSNLSLSQKICLSLSYLPRAKTEQKRFFIVLDK
jgi:hypothetical protein